MEQEVILSDKGLVTLKTPTPNDKQVIEQETKGLLDVARAYSKIESAQVYNMANADLTAIKTRMTALTEQRMTITRPMDAAKKAVMNLFAPAIAHLEEAERIIKHGMTGFITAQERARRAEEERQRRLAEEQERAARAEAARIARAQEEEAARKRAEAEALAEQAKNAAPEEAAQIEAQAQELAAQAEQAQASAEEVRVAAATAPPPAPIVLPEVSKGAGVSTREVWDFEIVDFAALPDEYKAPNEKLLRSFAQNTKGKVLLPGVKFTSSVHLAKRTR